MSDYLRLGGEPIGLVPFEVPVLSVAVHLDATFSGQGVIAVSPFTVGWAIRRVGWRSRPVTRSFPIAKIVEHQQRPGGGRVRYAIWSADWRAGRPHPVRLGEGMIDWNSGASGLASLLNEFIQEAIDAIPYGLDEDLFPGWSADQDAEISLAEVRTIGRIMQGSQITGSAGRGACDNIMSRGAGILSIPECSGGLTTPRYRRRTLVYPLHTNSHRR